MNKREVLEKARQLASTALLLLLVFTVILQQVEIQALNEKIKQASPVQAISTFPAELNFSHYLYHGNPFVTSLWPGQLQAENITFWHLYQWTPSGLVNKTDILSYPVQTADYIIYTDGTMYYAKNGKTGKIDFSGTDASTVIQYAINNANANGGGIVFVKAGKYDLYSTIYMKKGVSLIGENGDFNNNLGTRFVVRHDNPFMKFETGTIKILVENIDVTKGSPGTVGTGLGIDFTGVSWSVFRNIRIRAFALGIYANSSNWIYPTYEDLFEDVIIQQVSQAVYFDQITDIVFLRCLFSQSSTSTNPTVTLTSSSPHASDHISFVGVEFQSFNNNYALYLGRADYVTLYDVRFEYVSNGIYISSSYGGNYKSLILINTAYIPSTGKDIYGDTGYEKKVKIIGGYMPFFKNENSGKATLSGDGTTTQFSIAHGLASTPSKVLVTPGSSDAKGTFYVTADSTNIYVNYVTAPPSGTNNIVLYWYAEV